MAKKYAGFWLRFVAAIIDWAVLAIPSWFLMMGFMMPFMTVGAVSSAPFGPYETPDLFWAMQVFTMIFFFGLLSLIGQWLYEALLTSSSWQGTLGKRAVCIVVTDEKGKRISFGRATGRHFAKYLSAMILLIGYLMAAFTEKKQALHDKMADTLVIQK